MNVKEIQFGFGNVGVICARETEEPFNMICILRPVEVGEVGKHLPASEFVEGEALVRKDGDTELRFTNAAGLDVLIKGLIQTREDRGWGKFGSEVTP
ncbi:hypothetical protein LCGC14_2914190 [marine sediment metagenome]|uniref:Uncharacterized protein n=1 Tax=marine sediment metagenome TaxID=412755 RepID=A0A0F9AGY9_9ZZZZ